MADDRLRAVRAMVDGYIDRVEDADERRAAIRHLDGVASLAVLLALRRGLDAELAAVCGLVHDLYSYATGIRWLHAVSGAEMVRPMLRDTGLFTPEEVLLVVSAVFHHSDKAGTLRPEWLVAAAQPPRRARTVLPLAQRVADIAEALVASGIEGVPGNADYEAICRPFTGSDVLAEFHTGWCAAFVYACCQRAGLRLPLRHPRVSCRFGAVRGWLEWAQLDCVGLFRDAGCEPGRGDIVIYDDVLGRGPHDHIGVVLEVRSASLLVAEGNADGSNASGVVARDRRGHIGGYIRLDGDYVYEWSGEPEWSV
ncbi:MAG: HD domain-containing protein [Armatimonadetes bacterium]|nr:HD domain-containing protein [Armatimonadota bacterium]